MNKPFNPRTNLHKLQIMNKPLRGQLIRATRKTRAAQQRANVMFDKFKPLIKGRYPHHIKTARKWFIKERLLMQKYIASNNQ